MFNFDIEPEDFPPLSEGFEIVFTGIEGGVNLRITPNTKEFDLNCTIFEDEADDFVAKFEAARAEMIRTKPIH